MMNHAENLERALRASLTYEAARAESIRYACFDDTPERLVGQPHAWIETVLQVAEEEAGENVSIPWFAIGGIHLGTVDAVVAAGARSICVVSAILNAQDIAAACREFRNRLPA